MLTELTSLRRFQLEYSLVSSQRVVAIPTEDWSIPVMANFERRDYSAAEVTAHHQFEKEKDAYAFLLMVQAAARDGRHFDCLKYLERYPTYSRPPAKFADQLRLIAVSAYMAVRKINTAEALVNELVAEGKADRLLLLKKASLLGLQARFDEARELLLELNRQYSNNRAVLKKLVIVNEQLRDASKAAAFLRAYCSTGEKDDWAEGKRQQYIALGLM